MTESAANQGQNENGAGQQNAGYSVTAATVSQSGGEYRQGQGNYAQGYYGQGYYAGQGYGQCAAPAMPSVGGNAPLKVKLTGCLSGGILFAIGIGFVSIVGIIGLLILLAGIGACLDDVDSSGDSSISVTKTVIEEGNANKRIAVIDIRGVIARGGGQRGTSSEKVVRLLKQARKDETVKAIVLDMDTPGGEVTAADEIYQEVQACRKARVPVVTCMHSMGASGGYYIACASDWILANRLTFTGSVGVIMSSFNAKELGEKLGVKPVVIKSGAMKDSLSMGRDLTPEEQAYLQGLIDETFTEFATIVANGRERYADAAAVKAAEFSDGRVLSGTRALELGLIDELGGMKEAYAKAAELAKIEEKPQVVRFAQPVRMLDLLAEMKGGKPVEVRVNGLPGASLEAGKQYFIMPECVQ